jgi:archaellum component FlaC
MNMTNKVNIEFLNKQLEKALNDIEHLKENIKQLLTILDKAIGWQNQ